MKTDYEYYLLGCRDQGIEKPLSEWRFTVSYTKYQQSRWNEFADVLARRPQSRQRILQRLVRLQQIAKMVRLGQEIAARVRRDDDQPGAAGAGAREPRRPLEPVLAGGAAVPLPLPDKPDDYSWWRT